MWLLLLRLLLLLLMLMLRRLLLLLLLRRLLVLLLLRLVRQVLRRLELGLGLVLLRQLQLLLVLLVLLLRVCRVALLWRQLELALDVSGAGRVDKCPSLTARVAVVPQDVVEVRPSEDGGGGCSSHGALMGAVAWKVMEDACSRQRVSHARTAGAFTFLCCSQRCGSRLC